MDNIINQILEGNFNYDNRYLDFSSTKVDITINKGSSYEGSFSIIGPEGAFNSGTVLSSDTRMQVLTPEYSGENAEIFFKFDGSELEEGDVVRGAFFVVGNRGEYSLPFSVEVQTSCGVDGEEAVRNLTHFTTLAWNDWKAAVKLFYTKQFKAILGEDASLYDTYRALSANHGSEQNVEEFLIASGRKTKIDYLVTQTQLDFTEREDVFGVIEKEINIMKNGWGYVNLNVECRGDFLFTDKKVLTAEDFDGNVCNLPVFFDRGLCHSGNNFGMLVLSNSYVNIEIPVRISFKSDFYTKKSSRSEQEATLHMMLLYKEFRNKKISTQVWLKETGKIVDRLIAANENNIAARLFQVQLMITEEKMDEASWCMDRVAELLSVKGADETLYAYYMYLNTLIHRETDYVDRVTAEVEHIYRKDNSNWRIAWLLLFLSEEYYKSPTGKWIFLEKQFEIGCTSPVLYIEAANMINNNPALLRKLGAFEQQVVWYAVRHGIAKPEVAEQIIYLSERVKEYSFVLFRTLNRLYEETKDVRILQQICSLLIKGNRVGDKYFRWYRDGIENNLHITNLYEYFMLSIDIEKQRDIPKIVLMYFVYQNNLDYEHTAYMYDYILRHEDTLKDIFETYKGKMEQFCFEQAGRLHFSRNLANLYNRFMAPAMINERNCVAMSKILFAQIIKVRDHRIRKVFVYQPDCKIPEEYNIGDGSAWMPLYGSDYILAFEDTEGNRFVKSVEYTAEKLMYPGKFISQIDFYQPRNIPLDLYLLRDKVEDSLTCKADVDRAVRIADSDQVSETLRHKLMIKILLYYYEMDAYSALDEYLRKVPVEHMTSRERGEAVQYMVLREQYGMAEKWLKQYGPYFIDTKLLVKLLDVLIEQSGLAEEDYLVTACLYAFRKGRYDSTILYYLSLYYKGTAKEAREIWKASMNYNLDCYRLSEMLLLQMLYSGAFIHEKNDVFRYYVERGADPLVEELYLEYCSYEYYLKDKMTDSYVFKSIGAMYTDKQPITRICKLAYLKYHASIYSAISAEELEVADSLLEELLAEGIHLEFFREYKDNALVRREMMDKAVIEYRGEPQVKAVLHYTRSDSENGEYISEYMNEVCSGVFCKEFILFNGDVLHYTITDERTVGKPLDEQQVLEDGYLQRAEDAAESSRFKLINDIVSANNRRDYEKMDSLLEKYYKKEFLNNRLFELK